MIHDKLLLHDDKRSKMVKWWYMINDDNDNIWWCFIWWCFWWWQISNNDQRIHDLDHFGSSKEFWSCISPDYFTAIEVQLDVCSALGTFRSVASSKETRFISSPLQSCKSAHALRLGKIEITWNSQIIERIIQLYCILRKCHDYYYLYIYPMKLGGRGRKLGGRGRTQLKHNMVGRWKPQGDRFLGPLGPGTKKLGPVLAPRFDSKIPQPMTFL